MQLLADLACRPFGSRRQPDDHGTDLGASSPHSPADEGMVGSRAGIGHLDVGVLSRCDLVISIIRSVPGEKAPSVSSNAVFHV